MRVEDELCSDDFVGTPRQAAMRMAAECIQQTFPNPWDPTNPIHAGLPHLERWTAMRAELERIREALWNAGNNPFPPEDR